MDCITIQELLSAYIDNEITESERKNIEEHLENCSDCQEEYKLLNSLVNELNAIEEIDLPAGFHEDLMDKIGTHSKSTKKLIMTKKAFPIMAAAFLLVLIIGVVGSTTLKKWSQNDYTENSAKEEMFGVESVKDEAMEEGTFDIASDSDANNSETTAEAPSDSQGEAEDGVPLENEMTILEQEAEIDMGSSDGTDDSNNTRTEDDAEESELFIMEQPDSAEATEEQLTDIDQDKSKAIDEHNDRDLITATDGDEEDAFNNRNGPIRTIMFVIIVIIGVGLIVSLIIIYILRNKKK